MHVLALLIIALALVALVLNPRLWGTAERCDGFHVQLTVEHAARERDRIVWARFPLRCPLTAHWYWADWVVITEVQRHNTRWRTLCIRKL